MMEEEYLPLSSVEVFSFCRRQWALKYIEGQYGENVHTVSGDIFHKNAHNGHSTEKRGNVIISRGLKIKSDQLGCSGICDIVEFHKDENGVPLHNYDGLWVPYPVEYKVGKEKASDAERLQLCAQAICLEEMFGIKIPNGSMFYGKTRRRSVVEFDDSLRNMVKSLFEEMHTYMKKGYNPKPKMKAHCKACSLYNQCLPVLEKHKTVSEYLSEYI